jgi:hypothetical protein
MGMERIKHYRITCDGEIAVHKDSSRTTYDRCETTTVVEAPDKWSALRNLPDGWRATGHGDILDVRCTREHAY